MKIIAQIKKLSISAIVISILMGLLFIAFPDKCIQYISLAVGISFIAVGVVGIINYFVDRASAVSLAMGIIVAIIGIIICVRYKTLISLIVAIVGIFILATGVFNFVTSIKVITSSVVFGWVSFALSIATIVFGIVAITRSGQLSVALVQFIGAALIVYAVLDIISYIQVKKLAKQVKTAVESTGDIETEGTVVEE